MAETLHRIAAWLGVLSLGAIARAEGPPTLVEPRSDIAPASMRAVRETVAHRRPLVEPLPLPSPGVVSAEQAELEHQREAVRLALERARRRESEAAWDDCVREAAGAMSEAIEVIVAAGEFALLRDLHVQAGACMSLAQKESGANLHFVAAALLDESEPKTGMHREEAEKAQASGRAEVLSRPRGKIRIETEPSGAQVWIDGRLQAGTTPLETDIRLGDHFMSLRRFRFEPNTDRRLLQPSGAMRVVLDPARRATIRDQLIAVAEGRVAPPPPAEMDLARAVWSRAEHIVAVSPAPGPAGGGKISLIEASSGRELRSAPFAEPSRDVLERAVCSALGETCATSRGIPWYVWPLAGAVVAGRVITTAVLLENDRDTRFCPPSGCR